MNTKNKMAPEEIQAIKNSLKRRLRAAYDHIDSDQETFLLAKEDYIEYIQENSPLRRIIKKLLKESDDEIISEKESALEQYGEIDVRKEFFIIQQTYNELVEELDKMIITNKQKKTGAREELTYPLNGKDWCDVTIRFKDEFNVKITIGKRKFDSDCERLGFADRRSKNTKLKTKKSWEVLMLAAATDGVISIAKLTGKKRQSKTKEKLEIVNILKNKFEGEDDPFEKYDERTESYKLKIKLIPVQIFRSDYRDRNIIDSSEKENPYADLKSFWEEQSPSS